MAYWYWRPLKKDWVINEATTNKFDLPERGAVSALAIKLKTKNEADLLSYDTPFPLYNTSLRVVGNGNVEIMSLKGKQLHAINFWDTGIMPREGLDLIDTSAQEQYAYAMFGRYLGDPKYGLWLENFKAGVEFEDTNTLDITKFVDTETKYSIYALMRKDPEPGLFSGGYLRKRQIIDKDAASETEYAVKLPTLNKLRQIHLFSEPTVASGVLSTIIFTLTQYIWLSIKSKEEAILDNLLTSDWARFIHDYLGREAHSIVRTMTGAAGGYVDTMIYEKRNSVAQHLQNAAAMIVGDATTDQTRFQRIYGYLHDGTLSNRYALLHTFGICLGGDIPLLMTEPKASDESQWLDADINKDVYVEVTEGSSDGHWYIVLDELQKTYPS